MTGIRTAASPPRARFTPARYRGLLDRSRSLELFADLQRRYPDVVELRPGGRRVWLVSDPALARGILTEPGRAVTKGEGLRLVRRVLGDGLLTTTDVDAHRRHRRLIQPTLGPERVTAYAAAMVEAAARTSRRWRDGDVVDMPAEMARLTLDVVGHTLFGRDTDRAARDVADALDVVLGRFGLGFLPFADRVLDSDLPVARTVRGAVTTMRDVVTGVVDSHRRAPGDGDDVVSGLLGAQEDGAGLSAEQVRDEALTLLLAGHETTANALTWAWWLLDRTPRAAGRLHRELVAVLGQRDPEADDRDRLPYTTAVVAETMRLRPPAWMVERETLEPVTVGAYEAPTGTSLLTSPFLLHRDPRWWGEDALRFVPERWLDGDGRFDPAATGAPRGAYLPFGAGSRICIGESFAWTEAVLILATLARTWTARAEPGQRVGTWAAVTLRPHPGLSMRLAHAGAAPR